MLKKINSLKNHPGFRKYFANTSWLFGEKILRMVVGLFVGIWVARYLGPEQFGLLSYAQSFVGLFAAIATLGLDGIVVRELVKDQKKSNELMGTVFWLKLFGAFTVLLILAIAIHLTSNDTYTNTLIFIIASATIFQSFNVVDIYFQSRVLSKYVVYANVISLLFSSIIKIILILNEASLMAFAWMVLFDSMVLAVGYVYFYIKNSSTFKIKYFKLNKSIAVNLLRNSWPLILSGMVISIYIKIDQIMIKEMLNAEAVGQYAVAVKLSEIWFFIPTVITASLFPAIINAKKKSMLLYESRMQKLFNLMFWISLSIAFPISFLSDNIIAILYGMEYANASSVLMIHIWTGVFIFIGMPVSKWFIAENLQIYAFYRAFLGAIINIILNIILINRYGIEGAAIATLITSIVTSYLFNMINKKLFFNFKLQTKAFIFPLIFLYRNINVKKTD